MTRETDVVAICGSLAERGVDVDERALWELPLVTDAGRVAAEGRDPWTVRVEAPIPRRRGRRVARRGRDRRGRDDSPVTAVTARA